MYRRKLLVVGAASLSAVIAGCTGADDDPGDDDADPDPEPTGDDDADDTGTDDEEEVEEPEPEEEEEEEEDDGTLTFGDSFETEHGLVITASNPRVEDSYEYEDFGGDMETHEAPDGEQFAFVDIEIENVSGDTRESPNRLSFELVADGTQYETMDRLEYEGEDDYDGLNDLVDGVTEEGVLPFQITDAVDADEIVLYHSGTDFEHDASWEVLWEAG